MARSHRLSGMSDRDPRKDARDVRKKASPPRARAGHDRHASPRLIPVVNIEHGPIHEDGGVTRACRVHDDLEHVGRREDDGARVERMGATERRRVPCGRVTRWDHLRARSPSTPWGVATTRPSALSRAMVMPLMP